MKKQALYLLLLLFLFSCQRGGDIHYYITNNSDKVIFIKTIANGTDTLSFLVAANTTDKFIDKITEIKVRPKKLKFCPCEGAFIIKTQDTLFKITKDVNNSANWTKQMVKKRKFLERDDYTVCTFELSQDDINLK